MQLDCADPGASPMYAIDSGPAHGTTSGLDPATGQVTYTAAMGYTGSDSFTYHATSAHGTSTTRTVAVAVSPPAPTCAAVSTSTVEGHAVTVHLDCKDASHYVIDAGPSHGSLGAISQSGDVRYVPPAPYTGHDAFTYHATNSTGTSASATVSITVKPPSPAASGSAAIVSKSSQVSGDAAPLHLKCSSKTVKNCKGRVRLKTAHKFRLGAAKRHKPTFVNLGSATFKLSPGKTATVKIKLSKAALKLLSKHATLKALATVISHDGSRPPVTTRAHVTLKAPK